MSGASSSTPIQVHGDAVEYFNEQQKVVGTGHVVIDHEGTQLKADKITVNMATKVAAAEGNVVLTQKGNTFKGEYAEYDYAKKVGNVSKMQAEIQPTYFGRAERIEKVSENHYRAVDSYVTTCCGDKPFYRVQAQSIDIYPEEKVSMRNALLYVNNVPVLWIPFFETYLVDFDRFPVQITPGKNADWGPFVLSKWRYHLVERPELSSRGNVLLDWREKRGFGGGVENFYHGDKVGHGAVRTYFTQDQDPPEDAKEDRYRLQWRHQSKLTESTTLTTEFNKLSDPRVIKDYFFRDEYEANVFPDNYVSIITAKPEYTFSILDRERLDDFYTVVSRSPDLRFDTHTRPLFKTPFYLRQQSQFVNLRKDFANSEGQLDVVRADTNHTLSYAGHVGPVSVVPHVGGRGTFYSRDAASGEDHVRAVFDGGVDLSTRFFHVYDRYLHAWGMDYNQIRHIFRPAASYNFRPNPTVSRTVLGQFDALDALDKQNFMRFNFENKLQTKEHNKAGALVSREFLRVIPFFDMDFDTGNLNNIGIDAEARPYSWMGIEADAAYDRETRDFTAANFDVFLEKNNVKLSVGQRYVQDESSQTTADVRWKVNREWELHAYERFEFETNRSKEFEMTVSKAFDCFILDLTYNHRLDHGDTFFFALRLKNFEQSSFRLNQQYTEPKALYLAPRPLSERTAAPAAL